MNREFFEKMDEALNSTPSSSRAKVLGAIALFIGLVVAILTWIL